MKTAAQRATVGGLAVLTAGGLGYVIGGPDHMFPMHIHGPWHEAPAPADPTVQLEGRGGLREVVRGDSRVQDAGAKVTTTALSATRDGAAEEASATAQAPAARVTVTDQDAPVAGLTVPKNTLRTELKQDIADRVVESSPTSPVSPTASPAVTPAVTPASSPAPGIVAPEVTVSTDATLQAAASPASTASPVSALTARSAPQALALDEGAVSDSIPVDVAAPTDR